MKKTISLCILIMIVCTFACMSAIASDTEETDILYYGDYAYVLRDGQATIIFCNAGIGDFEFPEPSSATDQNALLYARKESGTEDDARWAIMIPDQLNGWPVVGIGDLAFFECLFTDVIIPEGITSIGASAFSNCYYINAITIPNSVTSIGEDAFNDSDGLALGMQLRVTEDSYAAQYAQENGIPYAFIEASGNQKKQESDDAMRNALSPACTSDELLIKQIDEYLTMSREEIIEKLGPDYVEVSAGPEGVCDGYYYEELGMAFVFYPDSDTLEQIDCYPSFKIHGVGIGSLFSEILEALGDTEIIETWLELPIYTAFMVRYHLGNADYSFIAFEEDAPVHILWIHQTP